MLPKGIWKIEGSAKGPTVCILGGVHGDELAGIEIVKKLLEYFELSEKESGLYHDDRIFGKIILGYGNMDAIEKGVRSACSPLDLNRMFQEKFLDTAVFDFDSAELRRARELAPILRDVDYLMDLHATSSPSPAFIVTSCVDIEEILWVSRLIPVDYILLDSEGIYTSYLGLEKNGSTDDYVNRFGKGIGFCYETGFNGDVSVVNKGFETVLKYLSHVGAIGIRDMNNEEKIVKSVFDLVDIIVAKGDVFIYEKGMGQGWQEIVPGQVVGSYGDREVEIVKNSGMYLFPTGESRIKKGESLYYVARKIR